MYYNTDINYVALEEQLNNMLTEEKILSRREGLLRFVDRRLEVRIEERLEKAEVHEELRRDYVEGTTKASVSQLYEKLEEMGLSKEKIRDVRRVQKTPSSKNAEEIQRVKDPKIKKQAEREQRENALIRLHEILLAEERLRLRKEANIASKVWGEFLDSDKLTGEATLEKIRKALKLTAEEIREFNSLVIVHVFPVDDRLRTKVTELRKATGRNVADFQNYACIGKEAWEAFYLWKEEGEEDSFGEQKKPQKMTSQRTLLKLVIGFGLEEPGAWEFMETAKSTFAVRRDLVVLACIRCGYSDPVQATEILDYFGEDDRGNLLYVNPYY